MKVFAIILVFMVIAALIGVGFLYFNSTLTATFASVIVTDPVTQQDAFDQLKSSLDAETFVGTRFSTSLLSSPENYLFYTWTVHLENKSFLPVDSIEIQITPMSGDVLLYGDISEHILAPHSSADLSATVLTSRDMHSVREATVTWYVWGLPFSARLTLGK